MHVGGGVPEESGPLLSWNTSNRQPHATRNQDLHVSSSASTEQGSAITSAMYDTCSDLLHQLRAHQQRACAKNRVRTGTCLSSRTDTHALPCTGWAEAAQSRCNLLTTCLQPQPGGDWTLRDVMNPHRNRSITSSPPKQTPAATGIRLWVIIVQSLSLPGAESYLRARGV